MEKKPRPENYRPDGRHKGAQYYEGHCTTLDDILHENLDYSLLRGYRHHKCKSRQQLAKKLAHDFWDTVIDDIIETGNAYKLPIAQGVVMRIVRKPEAGIRYLSTHPTAYKQVDMMESDFNMYEMVIDMQHRGKLLRRIVHLDKKRYARIVEKVHQGMRYQNGGF